MKQKLSVCAVTVTVACCGSVATGDLIDFEDAPYLNPSVEAIWNDEYVTRGVTNSNPDGAAGYILRYFGPDGFRFIAPLSGTRAVYVNTGVFPQPSFQRWLFTQPQQSVSFWVALSAGDRVGVRVIDQFGQETGLDQSIPVQPGQWTRVSISSPGSNISSVQIVALNGDNVSYSPWAIDDLSFVVPSPGAAGVLGLFALLNRRRR